MNGHDNLSAIVTTHLVVLLCRKKVLAAVDTSETVKHHCSMDDEAAYVLDEDADEIIDINADDINFSATDDDDDNNDDFGETDTVPVADLTTFVIKDFKALLDFIFDLGFYH